MRLLFTLMGFDFYAPDFWHDYQNHGLSPNPKEHTYQGSFARHLAVEKILYPIRHWLVTSDALPLTELMNVFLDIPFGLNCGFPLQDIGRHVVWHLKGGIFPTQPASPSSSPAAARSTTQSQP